MADLVFKAHGDALRLAASLTGTHFQGLASVASRLRRHGCSDRRLLRRLQALDAASAMLRHITVVSVTEMLDDLTAACAHVVDKVAEAVDKEVVNPVVEVEAAEKVVAAADKKMVNPVVLEEAADKVVVAVEKELFVPKEMFTQVQQMTDDDSVESVQSDLHAHAEGCPCGADIHVAATQVQQMTDDFVLHPEVEEGLASDVRCCDISDSESSDSVGSMQSAPDEWMLRAAFPQARW